MDPTETLLLTVEFEGVESAIAGDYARQLSDVAKGTDQSVQTKLSPSDPRHQELGTILSIVLGAKAVVVLARGISDWLKLRHQASITIKCRGGEIVAKNITAEKAGDLAKLIMDHC